MDAFLVALLLALALVGAIYLVQRLRGRWRVNQLSAEVREDVRPILSELGRIKGEVLPALKNAQEEYRLATASLELYEKVFRAFPQGVIVVDPDPSGTGIIKLLNHHAAVLFGYTEEELLGQPLSVLIPEANRTRQARSFTQAALSGSYFRAPFTVNGLKKDGTQIIIQHTVGRWEDADGVHFVASVISLER